VDFDKAEKVAAIKAEISQHIDELEKEMQMPKLNKTTFRQLISKIRTKLNKDALSNTQYRLDMKELVDALAQQGEKM